MRAKTELLRDPANYSRALGAMLCEYDIEPLVDKGIEESEIYAETEEAFHLPLFRWEGSPGAFGGSEKDGLSAELLEFVDEFGPMELADFALHVEVQPCSPDMDGLNYGRNGGDLVEIGTIGSQVSYGDLAVLEDRGDHSVLVYSRFWKQEGVSTGVLAEYDGFCAFMDRFVLGGDYLNEYSRFHDYDGGGMWTDFLEKLGFRE
ncbi:hypothetical protein [Salininema proteolyticum]|uniref:Knr4/Smi1-like domain-containing protein n=1 Tax=Salininema proteolyticum TaxID=1607685 RepID=A0ABV8TYM4_9ACTN